MFGYIGPQKPELKVRELAAYQAYYCGLCAMLGTRFCQTARLTLSYDCTFIALLLSSMDGCGGCDERRCPYKPLQRKRLMARPTPALEFAADLDLLLSWYKLSDDWQDERKLMGAAGMAALRGAAEKAKKARPALAEAVEKGTEALHILEKSGCTELDAPADAFAHMMRDCFACASMDAQTQRVLSALGYHMGRWVYLMDAWDDRRKDERSGAYNPFLRSGAGVERAEFLLQYSLNEAFRAYELLELKAYKPILDNILYMGCTERTTKLLNIGGKNEQQSV